MANSTACTVHIANLSTQVTEQNLVDYFKTIGNIVSVKLAGYAGGGKNTRFAFIEFSSPDEAYRALQFSGADIQGYMIKVGTARAPIHQGFAVVDGLVQYSNKTDNYRPPMNNNGPSPYNQMNLQSAPPQASMDQPQVNTNTSSSIMPNLDQILKHLPFLPQTSAPQQQSPTGPHPYASQAPSPYSMPPQGMMQTPVSQPQMGMMPPIPQQQPQMSQMPAVSQQQRPPPSMMPSIPQQQPQQQAMSSPQLNNDRLYGNNSGSSQYDAETQEKIARTIYVTGIDSSLPEKQLIDFFSVYGKVTNHKLCGNKTHPFRFGFFEFENPTAAVTSLQSHGAVLGLSQIKITLSKAPISSNNFGTNDRASRRDGNRDSNRDRDRDRGDRDRDRGDRDRENRDRDNRDRRDDRYTPEQKAMIERTIHVGGVAPNITENHLKEFFQKLVGSVSKVSIVNEEDTNQTRYAFVEFQRKESIQDALLLSGTELAGKTLKINLSRSPVFEANSRPPQQQSLNVGDKRRRDQDVRRDDQTKRQRT